MQEQAPVAFVGRFRGIRGIRHRRGETLHSAAFRGPSRFESGSTVLIDVQGHEAGSLRAARHERGDPK